MVVRSLVCDGMRSGVVLYRLCERLRGRSLEDYGRLVLPPKGLVRKRGSAQGSDQACSSPQC